MFDNSSNNLLIQLDIFATEENFDAVTGILVRQISYGWEEDNLSTGETRFRVYCDSADLAELLRAEISVRLPKVPIKQERVPRKDWALAWRDFFTPVTAGPFLILPPWLTETTPLEDHLRIVIEPKSAFGTGHHVSTTLCLQALALLSNPNRVGKDQQLRAGMRFFDLGTGTGILGIACCLLGLSGIGADIDPVAIKNALENKEINHIKNFSLYQGSTEVAGEEEFDLVMANILSGPLCEMAPNILAHLKPNGRLVLSGLLTTQADHVESRYYEALGSATKRLVSGEWTSLVWA